MARRKTHKDVEFVVDDDYIDGPLYFDSADEAAAVAIARAMSHGENVYIDVLVSSAAGGEWYRGTSEGAEEYEEDPDASIFERIAISADSRGRIP